MIHRIREPIFHPPTTLRLDRRLTSLKVLRITFPWSSSRWKPYTCPWGRPDPRSPFPLINFINVGRV